jgi:hypothetical protein
MITKIWLPQQGDVGKSVVDIDKHVVSSNVVNNVIKVDVGEDQNLSNVDTK